MNSTLKFDTTVPLLVIAVSVMVILASALSVLGGDSGETEAAEGVAVSDETADVHETAEEDKCTRFSCYSLGHKIRNIILTVVVYGGVLAAAVFGWILARRTFGPLTGKWPWED